MPQYEVVTSPGHQFPVGLIFESEALHPVMQQHVKLLRGKKVAVSTGAPEKSEGPAPEDLIGEGYIDDGDEAFDLAAAEYAERAKPKETVKPVVKPKPAKPANGPGANS